MKQMKRIVVVVMALALVLGIAGAALASGNPAGTGQPGQSCQSQPASPGNSSSAAGSAFNEVPGGVAGSHYAGTQPQNSKNPNSVAQYDVACYQVSNNPGH